MTQIFIEAVAAAIPFAGGLWAVARWTAKVDKNTEATDRLTASFEAHTEKVTGTLGDHEIRITLLERGKR